MKRIGIIAMAMTLVLSLSQCKKEQPTTANEGETVAITLDIQSNGGTRMDVNTNTGEVTYETGDVIYVASGGTFIGTLTHNGTNFAGTITNPTVGEPLHFYFLGNVTPAETLMAGATATCSVVISDQTEHLPVIEYAPSNETYNSGVTTFTAHLLNKCALVKFNVTTESESAICVTGFNNKVNVDFSENAVAYSQEDYGVITLPAGNGVKWAILLPQEAIDSGTAFSEDGEYTGSRGAVPAINENNFVSIGIAVTVNAPTGTTAPTGAIDALFTINENGNQVYFSQGNLQYIGSAATPYWKFADNQWDYLGTTTGQNSNNQNVDRDLFCWGTSGYNHGANFYQPWCVNGEDAGNFYAYGESNLNLYDQSGKADWGYNAISNGGNAEGLWRTPTKDEWYYLFEGRSTLSGIRYAKAVVNNKDGIILLPDNWTASFYVLNNTNNSNANYTSNTITEDNWTNILEANGAVFLPIAGTRWGTLVTTTEGHYWASSCYSGFSSTAYSVYIRSYSLNPSYPNYNRGNAFSVRLVHDVI